MMREPGSSQDWLLRPSRLQARLLATLRGARGLPVADVDLFACLYPGEALPGRITLRLRLGQVVTRTRLKLAPGLSVERDRAGYSLTDRRTPGGAWWWPRLLRAPLPAPLPAP